MVQRLPIPAKVAARAMPLQGSQSSGFAQGLDALAGGLDTRLQADRAAQSQIDQIDHATAMDQQKLDDQASYLKAVAERAKLRGDQAVRIDELQRSAKPGGEGHAEAVVAILKEGTEYLDTFVGDNERVRQMLLQDEVSYNASAETRETLWQKNQFLKHQGENLEVFKTASVNNLVMTPTIEGFTAQITQNRQVVDALAVNDDDKARIGRDLDMATVDGLLEGLIQKNDWQGAKKLIESGVFNSYIEDMSPWLNRIAVGERQAVQQADAEADKARQNARNDLKLIDAEIEAGVYVEPSRLSTALATAKATGVPDHELFKYQATGIQSQTNRTFADQSPATIKARMDTLDGKIAKGTATKDEQVERAQLTSLYDGAVTKSAKENKELLQTPYGRGAILQKTNTGDTNFDYATREAIEPGLGHVGLLPPSTQEVVIRGKQALAADPTLIPPQAKNRAAFLTQDVLRGMGPDGMQAVWSAADAIYADHLVSGGSRHWQPDVYSQAVFQASGGKRHKNQVDWAGGIQWAAPATGVKYSVWLPDGVSMKEFRGALGAIDYAADGAIYGDGSPVQARDVVANYTPVWVGYQTGKDGREKRAYRLYDRRGNAIIHKDGAPFQFLIPDAE